MFFLDSCIAVAHLGDTGMEATMRFTPLLICMERMWLAFADRGFLGTFSNLGGKGQSHKQACWRFLSDLMQKHHEAFWRCNESYYSVKAENVQLYTGVGRDGLQRIPNIFSLFHLTIETLRDDHVCPPVWFLANCRESCLPRWLRRRWGFLRASLRRSRHPGMRS
jgi:hypothetical protein